MANGKRGESAFNVGGMVEVDRWFDLGRSVLSDNQCSRSRGDQGYVGPVARLSDFNFLTKEIVITSCVQESPTAKLSR